VVLEEYGKDWEWLGGCGGEHRDAVPAHLIPKVLAGHTDL